MIDVIGVACITIAVILELGSYYKQISKTLRTKNSSQVSSSSFMLKIVKYIFTLIGLGIFANWVGFAIEVLALIFCSVALYIIAQYKPEGWTLFNRTKKQKRLKKRSERR